MTSKKIRFFFRNSILNNLNNRRLQGCDASRRTPLYNALNFIQGYGSSNGRTYLVFVLTARRNQNEIAASQLGGSLNNFNSANVIPYFFYASAQGTYVYNTLSQSFSSRASILQRQPVNSYSAELADSLCSLIRGGSTTTPSPPSQCKMFFVV